MIYESMMYVPNITSPITGPEGENILPDLSL